ncbi:TRASH domain-containing protein [Prosthecobacter dejongeii]|uniref:TRASH domain-containing protein n=1 Tax=Prosthecobacter dejongeii TaxID=48465 RepID=A0A7W7YMD7_9BACT|nr:TRASH domain-containing protein [Prosthecobacter dejongeii]MBB5038784.1 hypothetical protein [Prosthecobacter dejongeii]
MKRISLLTVLAAGLFSVSLATAADQTPEGIPADYPLKKCVVSDEPFGGEMGKPVKVTHEGTDVYLCCKACLKDFKKDPAKYTQKVKDAAPKK